MNARMSRRAAAAGLLAALAPAENALARAPGGNLIVLGRGAGPLELGMTDAEVLAALGPPLRTEAVEFIDFTDVRYVYADFRIEMQHGRLMQLNILSSRYRFSNGVGVGSQEIDVRAAFGAPREYVTNGAAHGRTLRYLGRRFAFDVDAQGYVTVVKLHWR